MAAHTSAMARAFLSSAALTAIFACVAAMRCTALLMLPRGMGHFQQLLQTCHKRWVNGRVHIMFINSDMLQMQTLVELAEELLTGG